MWGNSSTIGAMKHAADEQSLRPEKRRSSRGWITVVAVGAFVLAGIGACLGYLVFFETSSGINEPQQPPVLASPEEEDFVPTQEDLRVMDAIRSGGAANDPRISYLPTPLLAQYGSLLIHSPIFPGDLTEIEFHQASYDTALPMAPLVAIVDADEVAEKHGTNHIPFEEQPFGDKPLIAEAVSTWRLYSDGDEMTSVDVGAKAGTVVYAPVTGVVVKVKVYSLYGILDDYEVHIQSPDHPELDIVVLHIDMLTVKVGDKVYGGSTRIAVVRDLGEEIDSNLMNFTMPPDPGNHCHVQVNDATREDYKGLEGALDIFDGKGYARPEPLEGASL